MPTLANVRRPDPFVVNYLGVTGTPSAEDFAQAIAITSDYLQEWMKFAADSSGAIIETFLVDSLGSLTDPVRVGYDSAAIFAEDSQTILNKDTLNVMLARGLQEPFDQALLLALQNNLPPENPFSQVTGVVYSLSGSESQSASEVVDSKQSQSIGLFTVIVGACSLGFLAGVALSIKRLNSTRRKGYQAQKPDSHTFTGESSCKGDQPDSFIGTLISFRHDLNDRYRRLNPFADHEDSDVESDVTSLVDGPSILLGSSDFSDAMDIYMDDSSDDGDVEIEFAFEEEPDKDDPLFQSPFLMT